MDTFFVGGTGFFALLIVQPKGAWPSVPTPYIAAFTLGGLVAYFLMPLTGLYKSWRGQNFISQVRSILLGLIATFVALTALASALKETSTFSRLWFASWFLCSLTSLVFFRGLIFIILKRLRSLGLNLKRVVIYGAGSLGQLVEAKLTESTWTGYDIFAFFDDTSNSNDIGHRKLEEFDQSKTKVISPPPDLESYFQSNKIQELWIALPMRAEDRVREILSQLQNSTVHIRFVPNILKFQMITGNRITEVAGIPVIDINATPISGLNWLMKEAEDRVLAAIILTLVSPLMAAIAVAIRLESKGPILFKQQRHGWDGRVINVYKFRTMRVLESSGQFTPATKNDPRVTRVGAFLRKTSLDELPQFFNVLQGRMSIVGPRPHAVQMNEDYKGKVAFYFQRHKVKPGITGLAQVSGYRGEIESLEQMEKRVELDLKYIQSWSIWLDLKIIFLTIFKGFTGERAY